MTSQTKIAMPDLQRDPRNLYLINNVDDIVIFPGLKMFNSDNFYMFSCSRNAQVTLMEKHGHLVYT